MQQFEQGPAALSSRHEVCFEHLLREHFSKLGIEGRLGPILSTLQIDAYSVAEMPNTAITRSLETTLHYLRGFVSQPHPFLGREGQVCPFTPVALSKNLIHIGPFLGEPTLPSIMKAMTELRKQFEVLASRAGRDKLLVSLLMVFPEMLESEFLLVDAAQNALKTELVKKGFMVGQFHYLCQEGGVCNKNFRPLRSPVPMLALRHMTPGDVVFLVEDQEHLQAYCRFFKRSEVPKPLLSQFDAAIEKFGLRTSEEKQS